jgi:predicted amidophosphoribosyltransferase
MKKNMFGGVQIAFSCAILCATCGKEFSRTAANKKVCQRCVAESNKTRERYVAVRQMFIGQSFGL